MYFLTAKSYFANAKNNSYTHQSVVQFSDKFLEKKNNNKTSKHFDVVIIVPVVLRKVRHFSRAFFSSESLTNQHF